MAFVATNRSSDPTIISRLTVSSGQAGQSYGRSARLFADHWSRFLIKQTYKSLKPKCSFVEHQSSGIPTQGPIRISHGYEWFEMSFLVHWRPPGSTTILCFDVPEKLLQLLETALAQTGVKIDFTDPYSLLSCLFDQMLALYDESVWSMRNHVCTVEAVCLRNDYARNMI